MTEAATRLESVDALSDIAVILLESISLLLFPFMVTFLLGRIYEAFRIYFHAKCWEISISRDIRVRSWGIRRNHLLCGPSLLLRLVVCHLRDRLISCLDQ
jgi:hypothetical protein